MSFSLPTGTRRLFLRNAVGIALAGTDLGYGANTGDDPFQALPKSVWARARNNGLVMIRRPAPAVLTRQATIVPSGEPGTPLTVVGRVLAPDGTSPVAGITVYAYNTDADGYYGANHTEYPPRLYGWMKTDHEGSFELHTILPGRYPGMHVPAHVHFTLWGGKLSAAVGGRFALRRRQLSYAGDDGGVEAERRFWVDSTTYKIGRRGPVLPRAIKAAARDQFSLKCLRRGA